MEKTAKRKRKNATNSSNSKKPVVTPADVSKFPSLENFLRQSLSRQWIAYEWKYDEIEDAFFNKSKTFEDVLLSRFPQMKTHNLTAVEWRKIHILTNGHKVRRFSSKFIQEQRIELERFRHSYNVLQENLQVNQEKLVSLCENVTSHQSALNLNDRDEIKIYTLVVETKRLLATKSTIISVLREINNGKANTQHQINEDSIGNVNEAIEQLRICNEKIVNKWNKLMVFQVVKDALFFGSLERNEMLKTLSPFYFRRKCEIQIYENHCEFNSKTFITSNTILTLQNVLLELTLAVFRHNELAVNAFEFLKSLAKEHLDLLMRIMTTENIEYFKTNCLPLLFGISKKVCVQFNF